VLAGGIDVEEDALGIADVAAVEQCGRFEIYRCKIFHRIIIFVPYILWCYSEEI
jgi:hypothetical protein